MLNDRTDRVDLQVNRGSEALEEEEEEFEGEPRHVWEHPPLDIIRVQNSIEDLNKKKSAIRQKEKSRQRSPANTVNCKAEYSQGRQGDQPAVVVLSTERQLLRVPSGPASPMRAM